MVYDVVIESAFGAELDFKSQAANGLLHVVGRFECYDLMGSIGTCACLAHLLEGASGTATASVSTLFYENLGITHILGWCGLDFIRSNSQCNAHGNDKPVPPFEAVEYQIPDG